MAMFNVANGHTLINAWETNPVAPLINSAGITSVLNKSGLYGNDSVVQFRTRMGDGTQYGCGKMHMMPVDGSVSDRLLCIHFATRLASHINGVANIDTESGYILTFYSSNTEYRQWVIGGRDHVPAHKSYIMAIVDATNVSSAFRTTARFDPSNIIRTELHVEKYGMNNTFHLITREFYIDPYVLTGGTVANPVNMMMLISKCTADRIKSITSEMAGNVFLKTKYQIGNGTDETHFMESNKRIGVCNQASIADKFMLNHAGDNALGLQILTGPDCCIRHDNCTWSSKSPYTWQVSGAGAMHFDGCGIVGAGDISLSGSVVLLDCYFYYCGEIITNSPVWDNLNVHHATETYAARINDFTNVRNVVFADCNRAIRVTEPGDHILNNIRFRNNTFDIEVTHDAGEVIINVVGGDIPTVNQASTGTYRVVMSPFQLVIQNVTGHNIYIQDPDGNMYDYQENYESSEYKKAIPTFDREWNVAVKRIGYRHRLYSFVPRLGGDAILSGSSSEDLSEAGVPLYQNIPTVGVSVVFDNVANTAQVRLTTGSHSTQKIYNAIEKSLLTVQGMQWITNFNEPYYFPSALGNILVLHSRWRIYKASVDAQPTVLGAVQTTAEDNIITIDGIPIIFAGGSVLSMQNVRDALTMNPSVSSRAYSIDRVLNNLKDTAATKKDVFNAAFI